jgi:hypothetical protein
MRFAFRRNDARLFSRIIVWRMDGPYSHCEAVFGPALLADPGIYLCASASYLDHGVRFKEIALPADGWDIIDVPAVDPDKVRSWFLKHEGEPYDVRGLFDFLLPFPVGHNPDGWFCDEACAAAIGLKRAQHFDPNDFAAILEVMGGTWIQIDGKAAPATFASA